MENRILITGASGFIGTHVLNLLVHENFKIHAISRNVRKDHSKNGVEWYKADLLKEVDIEGIFEKIRPKYLIHLAWKTGSGLKHESDENILWLKKSKELISVFYKYGGSRVLVSGTCAEYDWNYENLIEDKTPLVPLSGYGKAKLELFNFIESFSSTNDLSYVWARIFFCFGPHQNTNSLVPYVIDKLLKNEVVKTTEGDQVFDYLYIEDIAFALVSLLKSDYRGAVNISSGNGIKLKQLISKIAEYITAQDLIRFGAIPYTLGKPMKIIGNNTILRKNSKWTPKYTLDEGLRKTINYQKLKMHE